MSEAFKDLRNFDDAHLNLLNRMVYDHWNWDSGNPKEKALLDAIEIELEERKMGAYATPPYDTDFHNGDQYTQFETYNCDGVRVGAGNYNNELVIKGANSIKYNGDEIITGMNGGLPRFGDNLESEIRRLIREEVHSMSISGNSMDPVSKDGAREVAKEEIAAKFMKILDL